MKRYVCFAAALLIAASASAQVVGGGPVIGGGGASVDTSAFVLLAGDADGQVIQGISGSDKARVDIGVVDTSSARLIGSGSTPAYVFADNQYSGIGSFNGTSSITVSDAQIQMDAGSGTASINFGTVNSWMDLTETYFELGVGAASLNISETAFRVVYGQTPPTNANDTCTTGDTIDTATFHYYCHATNTWVRAAMATW